MGLSPSLRSSEIYDVPPSKIMQRGQNFFDQVYGKVSKRVMGQMDRSGTEDLGLTARLMYGYILSNTQVLSPAESSFVLLAGLIPQDVSHVSPAATPSLQANKGKVNPQLKGHLKGALNNGASVEEVRAVRDVVIKVCEASGMKALNEQSLDGWGWRKEPAKLSVNVN
jgi:alkylhydroperoxidase/carboxymuconolactone decarboxylase family protein YurZ